MSWYRIVQDAGAVLPPVIVDGKEYTVEKMANDEDNGYVLTDARGRRFGTIRSNPKPHQMFLVPMEEKMGNPPKFWVTDEGGELRALGQKPKFPRTT